MTRKITSLEQATAYLEGLINYERAASYATARFDLGAIRALLARAGDPQRDSSVLHVAGSKGKGSTCLFAEAILRAAGSRVGTYTSPHLESWTERFRIDGVPVRDLDLARAIESLRPHVDRVREASKSPENAPVPSFFDVATAAAFVLFSEARVDHAVIEVGLGGRLDSTNVVEPRVTCITSIELEHTEKLGNSLAAIAGEKAGILKPGVPCVVGPLGDEAMRVVQARGHELGCPLELYGEDFWHEGAFSTPSRSGGRSGSGEFDAAHAGDSAEVQTKGRPLRFRSRDGLAIDTELTVLGDHQIVNACLAIAASRHLVGDGESGHVAARRGIASAEMPGRIEVVSRDPWIVIDSAHTPSSARELARNLEGLPGGRGDSHFVLSVSQGKDLRPMLDALLPLAARVTATRADPVRSLSATELAAEVRALRPDLVIDAIDDPAAALETARDRLEHGSLLCVTGSVYLAGLGRSRFAP